MLTEQQIKKIFKRDNLDPLFTAELIRLLNLYSNDFKIDTHMRLVRFLTQAVHETGVRRDGTVRVRENMNYKYDQLLRVSKFFRNNKKLAKKYTKNKYQKANLEAIANLMYADKNRAKNLRLGNTKEGDGWLYRGAGLFQTTGRENMAKDIRHLEKITGMKLTDTNGDLYKDTLGNYTMSILLGMAHWHRTGMWKLNSTTAITNKINRGLPADMKRERVATAYRVIDVLA